MALPPHVGGIESPNLESSYSPITPSAEVATSTSTASSNTHTAATTTPRQVYQLSTNDSYDSLPSLTQRPSSDQTRSVASGSSNQDEGDLLSTGSEHGESDASLISAPDSIDGADHTMNLLNQAFLPSYPGGQARSDQAVPSSTTNQLNADASMGYGMQNLALGPAPPCSLPHGEGIQGGELDNRHLDQTHNLLNHVAAHPNSDDSDSDESEESSADQEQNSQQAFDRIELLRHLRIFFSQGNNTTRIGSLERIVSMINTVLPAIITVPNIAVQYFGAILLQMRDQVLGNSLPDIDEHLLVNDVIETFQLLADGRERAIAHLVSERLTREVMEAAATTNGNNFDDESIAIPNSPAQGTAAYQALMPLRLDIMYRLIGRTILEAIRTVVEDLASSEATLTDEIDVYSNDGGLSGDTLVEISDGNAGLGGLVMLPDQGTTHGVADEGTNLPEVDNHYQGGAADSFSANDTDSVAFVSGETTAAESSDLDNSATSASVADINLFGPTPTDSADPSPATAPANNPQASAEDSETASSNLGFRFNTNFTVMMVHDIPMPRIQQLNRLGKPSVKHLECWWWRAKNGCKFSEDECLYAHHITGQTADAPRHVLPGEPARAGRSLEAALNRVESHPSREDLAASPSNNVDSPNTPDRDAMTVRKSLRSSEPSSVRLIPNLRAAKSDQKGGAHQNMPRNKMTDSMIDSGVPLPSPVKSEEDHNEMMLTTPIHGSGGSTYHLSSAPATKTNFMQKASDPQSSPLRPTRSLNSLAESENSLTPPSSAYQLGRHATNPLMSTSGGAEYQVRRLAEQNAQLAVNLRKSEGVRDNLCERIHQLTQETALLTQENDTLEVQKIKIVKDLEEHREENEQLKYRNIQLEHALSHAYEFNGQTANTQHTPLISHTNDFMASLNQQQVTEYTRRMQEMSQMIERLQLAIQYTQDENAELKSILTNLGRQT